MNPRAISSEKPPWTLFYPPLSRVLRLPHIVILATISTLLILAVMREQLLYMLGTLTGYSTALSGSQNPSIPGINIPPGIRLAPSKSTFRMSIFEDLHFGEDEDSAWAPAQDRASLNVMATILSSESPNLVVLNGDLITGENTFPSNSTAYLDMLVDPIIGSNIQFATVYGNHDNNVNISTSALFAREKAALPPTLPHRDIRTRSRIRSRRQ